MKLLSRAADYRDRVMPSMLTKSGIMVGLGEMTEEIIETMRDLRATDCDILTIGQYLQPSERRLPVERFYPPAEFAEFKRIGLEMGFRYVESGPLVRSSYHAHEHKPENAHKLSEQLFVVSPIITNSHRELPVLNSL